ncbi:hypothetical protein GCM10010324_62000 [Streptomyces hiroshimensis]|uniref:Uncharacterized protein n=1 Tax=Streptomyces hiroshimensis TaxID=66424 RepID=A0ABQ2Z6M8_9ACTN|nr:hypothetical protein GCM10010324_62000 [Streptomyces hiroshimensis]
MPAPVVLVRGRVHNAVTYTHQMHSGLMAGPTDLWLGDRPNVVTTQVSPHCGQAVVGVKHSSALLHGPPEAPAYRIAPIVYG